MTDNNNNDPTRMSNQPALTTSAGRVWMIVGTILAVICLGVLIAQVGVAPVLAIVGAAVVLALYVALWVVRAVISARQLRLITLAVLFAAMAAVTLVCVIVINLAIRFPA